MARILVEHNNFVLELFAGARRQALVQRIQLVAAAFQRVMNKGSRVSLRRW